MELLNDMALFIEVASAMSFTRASENTGIPNSTISRRISVLEKSIGLRLLHRTTRKVELTEAGQLYYNSCRRIVDEARIAHEQLGEMLAQPSGMLRVSLPVDFSVTYLAPLIAEFSRQYPGITFDFDLTPRRVDLITEPFDLAIRMGDLPSSHLIARPLAYLSVHLYASPRYIEIYGEPKHPSELVNHSCLSFPKVGNWLLYNGSEEVEIEVGGRFLVNSNGLLRRLATLDLGIVMLPTEIAADDLLTGQLHRILPGWQGNHIAAYALTETRLLPAKTQRFIDFLQEHLIKK
ncbi:LysR family transcriptional regulator [Acinetobacter baumannii]|uniref:LysR family transcriptional regulator n=1 Tax=Acinetobacter baumannii TaxID=470 RepID=UPI001BCC9149|nr:LysR family transcriptional regulator [Acinetobacter baumannii]EKW4939619.1 LysR family transcriptional regulator [Acinetobacter baumannii]ELS4599055.1 LysR family transcriptional regulator [Acinetobacter baumannii]MCA4304076.1 LysR family transcriptional regulator [Acinetobacter baumannii]